MRRIVALAAVVLGVGLASCASPRNGLNTPASACFRALPAATAAVGHKGDLVGVRLTSTAALTRNLVQAGRLRPGEVCAVAFRAAYRAGDVVDADPSGPGAYALVVLDDRGRHVLATFVVDDLPIRFRHRI